MYTIRTLDGFIGDILDPSFRTVTFDDEPHVVLVSKHLRYAWPALPSEETTPHGIKLFIKANHERSEEDRERVTLDPDLESLHTPWRDSIYDVWNHVFYDVMNFLLEVNYTVGHFHPPSHDAFALKYPKPQDGTLDVVCKSWDTNVLLIPAYRASKVSIRATVEQSIDERTSEKELGTFNDSNPAEIWYVRRGVKVKFYVEAELEKDCQGLAAVMVCGILCTENHETEDHETDNHEADNHETNNHEPEQQEVKTEPPIQD